MESMGQSQRESEEVCPDRNLDNKLLRKLLHRCVRLQEQVDSLVPQQVLKSLPEKTQVGSWQNGGNLVGCVRTLCLVILAVM